MNTRYAQMRALVAKENDSIVNVCIVGRRLSAINLDRSNQWITSVGIGDWIRRLMIIGACAFLLFSRELIFPFFPFLPSVAN